MNRFIIFVLVVAGFAQLYAQQESDSLKLKLNPVTVTATRYPEYVHEIPYAVSVLTARDFLTAKPFGFDEILSGVPGVLAQSRSGAQDIRITIRGFGARGAGDRSNLGTSRGLRVMVDGIPETEPDGRTSFDMVESGFAEKVEVIRSNASSLWGNASGGVVNISTIPDFTVDFLNLSATYGGFGQTKFLAKAGFNLDQGQVLVGFANNHFDGWRKHSESHRTMAAISYISHPSRRSTLGVHILASRSKFLIPGPLSLAQYNADPQQANFEYQARDERRFNRIGRIGVNFEHAINNTHAFSVMTFVSPKFLQRSERNTFRDFNRYHVGGNAMYRNSLTFANGITNKFVAGVDEAYQDGAIQFYYLNAANGRGDKLKDNKREGANNFGSFFQDEINFDRLSLLFGGRYDKVTYYSEIYANSETFSNNYDQKKFEHFTPKFGVTYKLNDMVNVYGNLGGGVEVPAGNETDDRTTANINPLLEPITSTTYELGVKSLKYECNSFLTGLSFDVAGYMAKVKNDIIPFADGKYYLTIGKSTRTGVEVNVNADFIYGFKVSDVATVSHNKYDTYTMYAPFAPKDVSYDGNKAAGLPSFTNTVMVNYRPVFFNKLQLGLQVRSVGRYFTDDANTINVPAYSVLNASVMYEDVVALLHNTGVRASLSIYNLTDAQYIASSFINPIKYKPAATGATEVGYIEPGLPMNASFTLSLLF